MMSVLAVCPFCCSENSCRLAFTKKSRPYLVCRLCYTRAFLQSRDALRGVAAAPHLLQQALRSPSTSSWLAQAHAALCREVDRYLAGPPLQQTSELPELPAIRPFALPASEVA